MFNAVQVSGIVNYKDRVIGLGLGIAANFRRKMLRALNISDLLLNFPKWGFSTANSAILERKAKI